MLRLLWSVPYPVLVQDAAWRIVDVNPGFVQFSGFGREALRGRDTVSLLPADDQEAELAGRPEWQLALAQGPVPMADRRLLDATGQERWQRTTLMPLGEQGLVLAVLQDTTAEHSARAQAERSHHELAQWFDLSPVGMLVFDADGLIVRSNRAFEALLGQVAVLLSEAGDGLQALLSWQDGAPDPALLPGAPPQENLALVDTPDGRRRLSARLSCFATEQGPFRYMAVVQDRSAEEERDLAQLEIGALMDTAGIFVATYDSAHGWLKSQAPARGGAATSSSALQGIARDIVEPESLPDYERLQSALRSGHRTEVRYAVRHPEMGQRWLLTRVEPGVLAGGRSTTSVVTLDVTDRERAQRRNEQLLRELGTILDGSTAGVAYLRNGQLVRCNHRFERMLGLAPGAGAGATLESLFALSPPALPLAREAALAVAQDADFDAEVLFDDGHASARWFTLSLRPAPSGGAAPEAVAVLSDITRLKAQQAELETLLRERELMFSLSEVGIVWQRGARIERANQAMAEMTGWSAPELTTLDTAELYASARDCASFEAAMSEGLQRNGRFAGERRLRRRDGSLLWVQVAARPVAADDASAGVVCSFVDVDERHRARESLQFQAGQTRAILDSVLVGIVTVADGRIEWMNRSARRMFGGELADFAGEAIHTVATPEADHPLRRADYVQRLASGQAETFECRLRGRDGREFWVVGNVVMTTSDPQRPQLTFALLDIERRRQAEVSIARAQASLQRVIETAPLAIALLDGGTREVLQSNQTATDLLALSVPGLQELLDEAPRRQELRHAVADDGAGGEQSQVWDTRVVTLPDAAGGPPQLLLVASDVTEQRLAEQARLQSAIAQREVLVREVHHRIKNNLQGVAGLLQQNAARQPELAAALSEAVGQVQAIAQVYGLQVGATGPLALAGLLRAICGSVQRTFGRTIVFGEVGSVPHLLPESEAIPVALTVNELLTNAIKHGSGDTVHCGLTADAAAVQISDSN